MEVLSLRKCQRDSVVRRWLDSSVVGVTIGNFDGMHRGHQELFSVLFRELGTRNEPTAKILLTFAPHPKRKLSGLSAAELRENPRYWHLTSPRRKIVLAERCGFDAVMFLRFSSAVRSMSAAEFVTKVLKESLAADVVVVGDDWRFGKGREGTAETLSNLTAVEGIATKIVAEQSVDGVRVSSSRVREALSVGDLPRLRLLLGRHFDVDGIVVHGAKRGRELGFPTANIQFREQLLPPDGVYAVWVTVDGIRHPAAASLGARPMFDHTGDKVLEAHLIDCPWVDLYGKRLEVQFVEFLRGQQKYPDIGALVAQMTKDVDRARALLVSD